MTTEYTVTHQYAKDPIIRVHDTEIPNLEARIAITLAEKFGIITAQPDGEDSAGRQKLCLLPPSEVAARACAVAEKLTSEIRSRNWMVTCPTLQEASDILDERDSVKHKEKV